MPFERIVSPSVAEVGGGLGKQIQALDRMLERPHAAAPVSETGLLEAIGRVLWRLSGLSAKEVLDGLEKARDEESPLRLVVSGEATQPDYSTLYRWVQCYAPELEKRVRWYQGYRSSSLRVDEIYVRGHCCMASVRDEVGWAGACCASVFRAGRVSQIQSWVLRRGGYQKTLWDKEQGMPRSILDQDVRTVLLQARTPEMRQVTVDGRPVDVVKPFASPADWRDHWIYFLMIDRFNNLPTPPNRPFDAAFGGFQGGTFRGIREQLGYIKTLGAGAIWITPPFQNKQRLNGASNEGTYHGYGIQHFLAIDPHFGTEQDLIDLVDEAHARDMYVIFDIVINHGGDLFQYVGHGSQAPFQSFPYDPIEWRDGNGNPRTEWRIAPDQITGHPDFNDDSAVLPLELLDNGYWRRQGSNLEGIEGDFFSLKELRTDFNQTTPERGFEYTVRNTIITIYQYIVARFDVDGFRIDTLRHVERPFARVFGNAMREFASSIGKKNFFTFGEVASNEEELARYTGRFAGDPDDLVGVDASLDFPLFFTLPGVIKGLPGNPPINLANLYEHRKNVQRGGLGQGAVISSHGEASRFFLPFLDNHDQHNRFRFVDPANPNRFDDQLTMAVGCLFGLQGIPVLYYGTEQGLHGAGNSDQNVREALWGKEAPFDTAHPFYQAIRATAAVRADQPALRYGRQYFRQVSGSGREFGISQSAPGIIAFSRILNDMEVVIVANAFTNTGFSGFVLVDFSLNPDGSSLTLLYSNKGPGATPPGTVVTRDRGTVVIHEIGGGTNDGPCRAIPFTMQPMEIQIFGRPFP